MKDREMAAELQLAEILYDTGELRFCYTRVLSADGTRWIRHGLFCEYHRNGTVISEGDYAQGRESGLWRDFYATGAPAAEGHYSMVPQRATGAIGMHLGTL